MTINRPRPYYRVSVVAGDYTWIIERDPDDPPPTPDYGLADPLRVKVALPTNDLLYANPDPCTGTFSLIVESMADIAGLTIGDGVNVRVWCFPVGTIDPSTGDPYPDWPEVNVRGRVANIDASPHSLGMFVTVRFVDYSVDLAELPTGRTDWPAETVEARLDRIGEGLGVANLGSELIQFGNVAARTAAPTDARSLLTAFLDGLAYTRPESVGDVMTGDGYKLIVGSVYTSVDDEVPSADRWWTIGVSNRLDFAPGELPAVLGEIAPGVYGVVVDDTPDEKLARILSADHVSFSARYGLAKSDRVNSWRVTLPDGTSEVVTEGGPSRVESGIQTTATDHRDARSVGRFNLNGSDSDGWKADRFTWYADMDPHRLRYPHLLFWDDVTFLRWFQFDPIVVDGIPAYQNPTGETWYAGQISTAELVLADGYYSVDLETRRNLPLAVPLPLVDEGTPPTPGTSATYGADMIALGPKTFHRLGEATGSSAADSSGNSRTGTYFGSPTLGVTGIPGGGTNKAVTFAAASNQYVLIPNTGLDTGQSFSGVVSVKGSLNTGERIFLARWDLPTATQRYTFGIDDASNGQPHVYIKTSAAYYHATVATNVLDGSWHHLVFTVDASNLKLYLDGALVATTAKAGTSEVGSYLNIGSKNAPGSFFNGSLDEVATFDFALSAAQVTALYASSLIGDVPADPGTPPVAIPAEYLRVIDLDPAMTVADLDPNLSAFDVRLLRSEL